MLASVIVSHPQRPNPASTIIAFLIITVMDCGS
jgi:hypothetical protein